MGYEKIPCYVDNCYFRARYEVEAQFSRESFEDKFKSCQFHLDKALINLGPNTAKVRLCREGK